ncbi:alpha/beta-hydrolase, partial [Mycena filopes]
SLHFLRTTSLLHRHPGRPCSRTLATLPTETPIELHYTSQIPSDDNETSGAIVLLHGLLGSSRNFAAHSRTFAEKLQRPVYALDLRNHGSSEHVQPMTYTRWLPMLLTSFNNSLSDVSHRSLHVRAREYLDRLSFQRPSRGGKVAMAVALESSLPASTLSKLIVVDIAPARGTMSAEFHQHIKAMKEIEAAEVSQRKEALRFYNRSGSLRLLLTNLIQKPNGSRFRIPLDLLGESATDIGYFPFTPEEAQWTGKTLFIKGSKSNFLNRHNIPLAEKFFPNMRLETLDTHHWGEPNEFSALVQDFVGPLGQ